MFIGCKMNIIKASPEESTFAQEGGSYRRLEKIA